MSHLDRGGGGAMVKGVICSVFIQAGMIHGLVQGCCTAQEYAADSGVTHTAGCFRIFRVLGFLQIQHWAVKVPPF